MYVTIFPVVFIFFLYALYVLIRSIWKKDASITSIKNNKNWYKRPFLTAEQFQSEAYLFIAVTFIIGFVELLWQQLGITLSSSWIYIVLGALTVGFGYYIKSMLTSFYGIVVFFSGYFLLMTEYAVPINLKGIIALSLGFIFIPMIYHVGLVHYKHVSWKRFGFFYQLISIFWLVILLFMTSFEDFISALQDMIQGVGLMDSTVIFIMYSLILLASLSSIIYSFYKKSASLVEVVGSLFFVVIGILLLFFPENLELYHGYYYTETFGMRATNETGLTTIGYLFAGGFNALLFIFLLGQIGLGYKLHEVWKINLGILGLFIFIIIKYFDWFFSFMEKSLFFITAGIIVLGIGFFMEKGRRYMISQLEESK